MSNTIVNEVDNHGCEEGPKVLSKEISGNFPPRELFRHGERKGDGRIEMTPADAPGDVYPEDDPDSVAPVDAEDIAVGSATQDSLCDTAIPEDL
jgi:hypothetical protein